MELRVKGKFVTSSKVKNFKFLPVSYFDKINENDGKKIFFGYHDELKIYGAPKVSTVM